MGPPEQEGKRLYLIYISMTELELQQYLLRSTHRRTLAANGRNLRILRTRSVGTKRMMLFPMCRLSPTWREEI